MLDGNSNSVKDTFRFYEKLESKVKQYILSHSKIDEATYGSKIERYEFYLTAEDMLKYGLVDEIIGHSNQTHDLANAHPTLRPRLSRSRKKSI